LCWSEDGSLLASAAADNVVRIWRTDDWIKIKELMNVHTNWVTSVKFLPRALEVDLLEQELHSRLLSASADRTLVVWGLGPQDWPMLKGRGHGSWINDVIVREDGIIATGSSDTKVRLWRLRKVRGSNTTADTGSDETKKANKTTRRKTPPDLVLDSLTELSPGSRVQGQLPVHLARRGQPRGGKCDADESVERARNGLRERGGILPARRGQADECGRGQGREFLSPGEDGGEAVRQWEGPKTGGTPGANLRVVVFAGRDDDRELRRGLLDPGVEVREQGGVAEARAPAGRQLEKDVVILIISSSHHTYND
jgi:hypothetical protein